jgi:hypothetical protein
MEQCPSELIGNFYWDRQGSILGEACLSGKEHQMNNERKSSKAGDRAAEGLREATAKEEAKTRAGRGTIWLRALIASKNALKAPMEKAHKKNRKGELYRTGPIV